MNALGILRIFYILFYVKKDNFLKVDMKSGGTV
jgi:hypothetical protein